MKKTLYLMRHGQTLFNFKKIMQGAVDSPLTKIGIEQAKIAKKYFEDNNINFTNAYSSTQERASDTLEIITDLPYIRLKSLKEMSFGNFDGESEFLHPLKEKREKFFGDFYVNIGGENITQVNDRVIKTLNEIMEKEGHKSVLIVSHGVVCHAFYNYITGNELNYMENCTIFKYEYENGKFEFKEIIEHDFSNLKQN